MESEEELTSSDDSLSESDNENDGLEGTYNQGSSYFDIFDNLMSKYVRELNDCDEAANNKLRDLGKMSLFSAQRLERIEQDVTDKFYDARQFEKASNVIFLKDRAREVNEVEKK